MATVMIRATTAIPAATRNPREIPTARAWCSTAGGAVPLALAGSAWPAAAAWATWCLTLFDTTVQVTVPRAASPIAPPTCWPVLSRLDATPESSPRTLLSATSDSGTNSMPSPAEVTSIGPSRPLTYWLCTVRCENQYMPTAVIDAPATMNGRAPTRLMSWDTTPDISTTVPANGRNATPDLSALYPRTSCTKIVRKKKIPNMAVARHSITT